MARRSRYKPVRVVRSHARLFFSAAVGAALFAALTVTSLRLSARLILAWDLGALVYLALAAVSIRRFDIKRVQVKADQEDEGGVVLLMITVAAAIASIAAIVTEIGAAKATGAVAERQAFVLAAVTIMLSWTLIQTIFAFHYAHRFYRGPGDRGSGLAFPSDEWPDYWDFVYFAFVVGMTFQVSDVQVTSKSLRRLVVAHGMVSFVFNVAIVALAVNIGSGLL